MDTYKLVIAYNSKQYSSGNTEDTDTYLLLDTVTERAASGSNTIASQPMQNGETISDHTYRNPDTYTISGSFSLDSSTTYNLGNGSKDYENNFTSAGADRLTRIQETFEGIKKSGYLCTLTFMNLDDTNPRIESGAGKASRFKVRKNMQLESFQWSERLNGFKYNLTFKEVVLVGQQEYYDLPLAEQTYYKLPRIGVPSAHNLSKVLTEDTDDSNKLYELVITELYNKGYIEKEFIQYLAFRTNENLSSTLGKNLGPILVAITAVAVAAGIVWAATTVATAATIATVATITTAAAVTTTVAAGTSAPAIAGLLAPLFPVGTIIAGAIAIAATVVATVNIVQFVQKQSKVIKLRNNSPLEGLEKLNNLLSKVKTSLARINSNVDIYKFDYSDEQQTYIKIAGKTYVIEVCNNNTTDKPTWIWKVLDTNLNQVNNVKTQQPTIITSMTSFNEKNIWFNDPDNLYEIFLVNLSLGLPENQKTEAAYNNVYKNVNTFTIWVSEGNMEDNIKLFIDGMFDVLSEEGFN